MFIDPPEKRKDYYVSRMSNKKSQPYTLTITEAKVVAIHEIANDGGYIVKIWVPESFADTIQNIDEFATEASREHNQEWFNNALPKDRFSEYFRPSIDERQMCTCLVSMTKIPRSVIWCGEQVDDFEFVAKRERRELQKMSCTCTLEIQGLYFYPKKFGVRWIIRNIEFFDPAAVEEESDEDNTAVDREDIETFWNAELMEVIGMLDNDVAKLQKKMEDINSIKNNLHRYLATAKKQPECNSVWDESLEALKTNIFQYKSGRL